MATAASNLQTWQSTAPTAGLVPLKSRPPLCYHSRVPIVNASDLKAPVGAFPGGQ